MLEGEVLVGELLTVDGLAASALFTVSQSHPSRCQDGLYEEKLTLPRVKSPPWSMNWGMIRWKEEPL